MKIFLDENMPHDLVKALSQEGHEVESVYTLDIAGVKNGELYKKVKDLYDLLFTKDVLFNEWAKRIKGSRQVRFVLVTLPQKSQELFVKDFISCFRNTNWAKHVHGSAWPK